MNIPDLPFFPQHLCFGSPFLPPLSVSTVIAGPPLFRPPRGPRDTVIIVVVIVVFSFYYLFFSKVFLLKADFHYTTIFLIFPTYRFFIIFLFITKVNIDIGTKILKQKCFGRKTYIPGTFFNFKPAKKNYGSSSIRSAYSRGCGTSILMSFLEIRMRPWICR